MTKSRIAAILSVALAVTSFAAPVLALDDAALQKVLAGTEERQLTAMKALVAHPPTAQKNTLFDHVDFALAAYWLQQRMPEADQAMITACDRDAVRWRGNPDAPTSKHSYYKQLYLLERVYFLFHSGSEYFPGRMSPAAEKAVTEMLWHWVSTALTKETLAPERDWQLWGTENIGAVTWSSLWGATQIVAAHPEYRDRQYADGTPVPEMARAFNAYYQRFTRERAGKGLLIEAASDYNKWTLNCWYNIADFSLDPLTRQRMRMFLDLYWADWAIEQIDTMRGGSRHRCYPGVGSTEMSDGGDGPCWYLFGLRRPAITNPALLCAATTSYRPAPVVADLVLDVKGRGTYAYVSRRPGAGKTVSKLEGGAGFGADEEFLGESGGHVLKPEGGNLLRYTWCTPNFIMGTSMVLALPVNDWALISSQNRWEGVIFGGHATARIFVQPIASGSTYNANWSVQNKGVMIVQRLATSMNCSGQRIWFDRSLRRVESSGWVFAEAPGAYAAVRVVDGPSQWQGIDSPLPKTKQNEGPGYLLSCGQEFTPVILEVASKTDCKSFEAFQKQILANPLSWENKQLRYRSSHYQTELTFYADYAKTPEVDGTPINYNPPKAYESPFINGAFGSGKVTIRKDQGELALDFTKE